MPETEQERERERKIFETHLVYLVAVNLEPADVDVLGGLLPLAQVVGGIGGCKNVQQKCSFLGRQKMEGCCVTISEHHQVSTQRNLKQDRFLTGFKIAVRTDL